MILITDFNLPLIHVLYARGRNERTHFDLHTKTLPHRQRTHYLRTRKTKEMIAEVYKCDFQKNATKYSRINLEVLFVGLRHAPHEGS